MRTCGNRIAVAALTRTRRRLGAIRPMSRRYCRCGAALAHDHRDALCSACQCGLQRDAAPEVPVDFWTTHAMPEALASGDLGRVLRAYRCHPFHGRALPQQLVAGWLHMSQSTLSRIESGARRHTVDDWVPCARVLGAPVSLPWVRQPERDSGSDDVDPINRRSLLGHAAGGLAAVAGGGAQPVSAADVDPELVPHWLELKAVLTGQDQMFGSHQVLGIAQRGLGIIGRHREVARGHMRIDLMRVEARWEMLVAWLHDDAGNPAAAKAMERARALAAEADDRLMLAYVLMRQSERASRRGDDREAIGLAQAAQRQHGLTAHVRALSALHKALGHALAGDASSCQDRLVAAHDLVAALPHDDGAIDPGFDGLGRHYATPTTILANEARCWLWLGEPRRAVDAAEARAGIVAGDQTPWQRPAASRARGRMRGCWRARPRGARGPQRPQDRPGNPLSTRNGRVAPSGSSPGPSPSGPGHR